MVPLFVVKLVELWPKACDPDRGMKICDVVVVSSSDICVALGCFSDVVVATVRSGAVRGITLACCSSGYIKWIGLLLIPLPFAISFITSISSMSSIINAFLSCGFCLCYHTTDDANVVSSFHGRDIELAESFPPGTYSHNQIICQSFPRRRYGEDTPMV